MIGQFSGPLKCKVVSVAKLMRDLSPKLLKNLASKGLKLSFALNCVRKRATDLKTISDWLILLGDLVQKFDSLQCRRFFKARGRKSKMALAWSNALARDLAKIIKLCLLLWLGFFKTMKLLLSVRRDFFVLCREMTLVLNRVQSADFRWWHFCS